MDKATIELTKEEAALLPLLYKVPVSTNLESAVQMMRQKLILDGLMEKVRKAFEVEPTLPAETQPAPPYKPKRKRH